MTSELTDSSICSSGFLNLREKVKLFFYLLPCVALNAKSYHQEEGTELQMSELCVYHRYPCTHLISQKF